MLSSTYLIIQLQNQSYDIVTYVNFIKTHVQPLYPTLRPLTFPDPKHKK